MAEDPSILVPQAQAPAGVSHRVQQTFWQKKWVQNVLPWATSSVLHLTIIILVVAFYQAIQAWQPKAIEQEIIPEAATVDGAPVGGVPNPGVGQDPTKLAAQDQVLDSQDKRLAVEGQKLNAAMASSADGQTDTAIGIGPGGGFAKGAGSGTGSHGGGPWGVPGGSGLGIPIKFAGSSGNASKVVYICDASGSMMSVFPQLQRELDKSIDSLKVPQSFGVLFFSDQTLFLDKSLMLATASNKKKAYEFVAQMAAHGTTEPKSAIQMAFAMQPQLIFVLTDGFDQGDPNEVAKQFRNLNVGKKVKINTILLRSADDPELIKVLKTIASENGGSYKEVDKQDF
jgi:hypothetical protein